jgi:amino acid transporter
MGALIVLTIIIGFFILLGYLNFPPAYANKKLVRAFDMMAVLVCAFICLMYVLKVHVLMADTRDDMWWEPKAAVGAVGIEAVFLGLCFLFRNFWVFKPPSRPGGGSGIL